MLNLQIHGFFSWIPIRNQFNNLKCNIILENLGKKSKNRRFSHTHQYNVSNNVGRLNSSNSTSNLINYQRNTDEIPCMETHSLTKAMMQSSKSGFNKKKIWKKYISRSLELRNKLSIKNISIIMISAAKSNVKESKFYEQMSERILTKAQNYINTYKMDPKRFFTDYHRTEFTAFNIYTVLSACLIAGYKDEKLFKTLYKVSEIKLLYFNDYLDKIVGGHSSGNPLYLIKETIRDDQFTFEDVAGILHVYTASNVVIPQMVLKYSEIFKKMYKRANDSLTNGVSEIGEVTPKSVAIIINSLVKLGNRSEKLFRIGLEYLLSRLESLSLKDTVMIFNSIVKISASLENLEAEYEKLLSLADKIIDKSSLVKIDPESLVNLSSAFITISKLKMVGPEEFQIMKSKLNKLFGEATYHLVTENEIDNSKLIHLINNSSLLGLTAVSMLISESNLKSVGLTESISDISQFLTSLVLIYSSTRSNGLRELINEHVVMALRQYGKRLNYVLYPNSMGLSNTRARPSSLYEILKLDSKGLLDVKPDNMNQDWKRLTKDISEFTPENIGLLASIFSVIAKFNPCKDFLTFITPSTDYILKFFKFHSHEFNSDNLQIESLSAIINTLAKYRIKNDELMEYFSKLIKNKLDIQMRLGCYESVNKMALFNLINSYSRLGMPKTLFSFRNGYKWKGRAERSDVHSQLFKTISKMLSVCNFDAINLRMVVNGLYGLSLVGFDKFGRIALVRLLDKFIKTFPNQSIEISNKEPIDSKEGFYIPECVKELDTECESDIPGAKQLYSQVNIILMMINLAVKNNFFRSRVFNKYLKSMKKLFYHQLNRTSNYEFVNNKVCELDKVSANRRQNGNKPLQNKMSGLHRSVLTVLKNKYREIQSEVVWKRGTYSIDIVIKDGRRHKFVEIDGPYHYYLHTTELLSSSRSKHNIISNYGHRLIHIPYFEWAKCENDEQRTKYLSLKLKRRPRFKTT